MPDSVTAVALRRLAAALTLLAGAAHAQPRLAAELNTTGSSAPNDAVALDGQLYFAATNRAVGRELWAYDPVAGTATLAADILPGVNVYNLPGSYPYSLAVFDGELFFGTLGASTGRELWAYDPAAGAARFVSDVGPGTWSTPSSGETGPGWLTALGGRLYYAAYGPGVGEELWAYDGATGQVSVAADIRPGLEGSDPMDLAVLDGRLYFNAGVGASRSLWVYDPATGLATEAATTTPVIDPRGMMAQDGVLYYVAGTTGQRRVWSYDPATDVATAVAEGTGTERAAGQLAAHAGRLYFQDYDPAQRLVLWSYDPASGVTQLATQDYLLGAPTSFQGRLVYRAVDPATDLPSLRQYDPATGLSTGVAGLPLRFVDSTRRFSYAHWEATVVGDQLFLGAGDGYDLGPGAHGVELWAVDGPSGVAALAADVERSEGSNPSGFTEVGGQVFFAADDGVSRSELWAYRPATGAARLAADLWPGNESRPRDLTAFAGELYFTARTDLGRELWAFDPVLDQARLVADLAPGAPSGEPSGLVELAGRLYVSATDGLRGQELWAYDPASGQATLAADIRPGSESSWADGLTAVGGRLFFQADDGVAGRELWTYDPATATAALVADVQPGPVGSLLGPLVPHDGELYVQGSDGTPASRRGFWVVDPATLAVRFVDVGIELELPDPFASTPSAVSYLGRLYFNARDAGGVRRLWAYDAATGLTERVEAFGASDPREWTVYDGRLYVSARTPESGTELWSYDAATGTADLVADLTPGPAGSGPSALAVVAGRLYFRASTPLSGAEVWAYDAQGGVATEAPVPVARRLSAPSPNPTSSTAQVTLAAGLQGSVRVTVHDVLGRELMCLHDGPLPPGGPMTVSVDARALPAGVYAVRVASATVRDARTFTVIQ